MTIETNSVSVTMTFQPRRNTAAAERARQILLTSFLNQNGTKKCAGTFAVPEDLGYHKAGSQAGAP
ncbi:MAG: hypothetical protein HFF17_00395 [Oscillospiraceae bacterium]|nr:hypothetical protein [Oscillospiraceae bacterium]